MVKCKGGCYTFLRENGCKSGLNNRERERKKKNILLSGTIVNTLLFSDVKLNLKGLVIVTTREELYRQCINIQQKSV